MMYQSRATVDPVASYSVIAYPVDMESRRKKSRSSEELQPGAKNPVAAVEVTTSSEAVDDSLRRVTKAVCQLLSLFQNAEDDKKACKRKDTKDNPCRYFQEHI
ncbi:hypothetical protein F511_39130 [Dorcoceras hygrometricum]|uniref:Uncharacterized protein n=1 Tax=Dorcoceras hygrometricum TaxID=472368 RepID=A0A2Z7CGM3_9LAMI|nr:hypothetical protein F511_39130 [Dorcoceras hygrometricum]